MGLSYYFYYALVYSVTIAFPNHREVLSIMDSYTPTHVVVDRYHRWRTRNPVRVGYMVGFTAAALVAAYYYANGLPLQVLVIVGAGVFGLFAGTGTVLVMRAHAYVQHVRRQERNKSFLQQHPELELQWEATLDQNDLPRHDHTLLRQYRLLDKLVTVHAAYLRGEINDYDYPQVCKNCMNEAVRWGW